MPFVRIKPLNPAAGYKLRSFQSRDGLRIVMGDDTDNPKWHECTDAQAKYLASQRVSKTDPGSACKFDIMPDKKSADAFIKAEKAKRNKQDEGTSLENAIPLSDEIRARGLAQASELDALKARLEAQEAELAFLRNRVAKDESAPPDLMAAYSADQAAGPETPEASPEPASSTRSTTITSALTGAAKRPTGPKAGK